MAKKKRVVKKTVAGKKTAKKSDEKPARQRLRMIEATPAPVLMRSEEVGAHVAQDQAIREKVRLYPRATVNEIVAMFELEGFKISPAAVKKVKGESR